MGSPESLANDIQNCRSSGTIWNHDSRNPTPTSNTPNWVPLMGPPGPTGPGSTCLSWDGMEQQYHF